MAHARRVATTAAVQRPVVVGQFAVVPIGLGVARLMLVGHNPGIEELVSELAGHDESMPTAALACFQLAVDRWSDLNNETAAELLQLWRPKEL